MTNALTPKNAVKLDTLRNVRSEMGRLYRLWVGGKIEPTAMNKGIYALGEIRGSIEGEMLADIEKRLATLALKEGKNG